MPETPPLMHRMGDSFLEIAETVGGMGVLAFRIVVATVTLRLDGREVMRNLYRMGVKSVPIVIVTALFTGAIMVIQAAPLVQQFGAHGLLGWGAGFGTLREIAPLLTALMINGRVGANNTAEARDHGGHRTDRCPSGVGHRSHRIPRRPPEHCDRRHAVLSTVFADVLALVGAAYAGQLLLGVAPAVFYNGLTSGLLGVSDVLNGLVKSVVFGIVMALSSCQYGLGVKGGAPGVGKAVNATVVASAAGIFILDYLVSFTLP